jgi:hypothetical protein
MAGHRSLTWHPLMTDLILLGQKLEGLGFVYSRGKTFIVE